MIYLVLKVEGRWVVRLLRGVFVWRNNFKGGSYVFISLLILIEFEIMNCDIDIDSGLNYDFYSVLILWSVVF